MALFLKTVTGAAINSAYVLRIYPRHNSRGDTWEVEAKMVNGEDYTLYKDIPEQEARDVVSALVDGMMDGG